MILPVTANGVRCYSDTFRTSGGHCVLLSMFGDRNAVRACWATFHDRKRWPAVEVNEKAVLREEGAPYTTIQTPIGKDRLHCLIVHVDATKQADAFRSLFYQVGPDAESRYFDRFSHRCCVPMRPSWKEDLWTLGLEKKAIQPLPGFGLPVSLVMTSKDLWAPLIQEALVNGTLS